jgi:hypothetical protein
MKNNTWEKVCGYGKVVVDLDCRYLKLSRMINFLFTNVQWSARATASPLL